MSDIRGTVSSGGRVAIQFGGDDTLLHPKQNVLHRRDLRPQHGVLAAASRKSSTYDPVLANVPFDQELDRNQPFEQKADLGTKDPPSPRLQKPYGDVVV
jgi:hypothetical protein